MLNRIFDVMCLMEVLAIKQQVMFSCLGWRNEAFSASVRLEWISLAR